jgi:hypothetical protein
METFANNQSLPNVVCVVNERNANEIYVSTMVSEQGICGNSSKHDHRNKVKYGEKSNLKLCTERFAAHFGGGSTQTISSAEYSPMSGCSGNTNWVVADLYRRMQWRVHTSEPGV